MRPTGIDRKVEENSRLLRLLEKELRTVLENVNRRLARLENPKNPEEESGKAHPWHWASMKGKKIPFRSLEGRQRSCYVDE